ncbi:uncharacterized protein BDR25DRAFT_302568, partial [Lindgomyces ingoldianus]
LRYLGLFNLACFVASVVAIKIDGVKPPLAALRGLLIPRGYVKVYNVRGIEQETQVTERECRIGG